MTPADIAFTYNWWTNLLKDEERLHTWLIKLEATERQGYDDNLNAIDEHVAKSDTAARQILRATADDEMRHADMLDKIITARSPKNLSSCAAVFALGEGLASDRFSVMSNHPDTPTDIQWFLDNALPDEQHHCRIFTKLAGESELMAMRKRHDDAIQILKGAKK